MTVKHPVATYEHIKVAVVLTPTLTTSALVGIIANVNDISWNEACDVVSNNELYGQDGAGSMTIYRDPECNGDLTPYAKRAVAAIFLVHRNYDSVSIVQD